MCTRQQRTMVFQLGLAFLTCLIFILAHLFQILGSPGPDNALNSGFDSVFLLAGSALFCLFAVVLAIRALHRERDVEAMEAQAEELAIRRRLLESVVKTSPAVAFRWKAEEGWPVEFVSGNVKHFGYAPDDFLSGRVCYADIIHPDDLDRIAEEVTRNAADSGIDRYTQEYRIRTRSGDYRWLDDRTRVSRDASGRPTHFQGVIMDITERKEAELALRIERDRAHKYLETAAVIIAVVDRDERVRILNRKGSRDLGYKAEEIRDRNWFLTLFPEEERLRARAHFQTLLRGEDTAPRTYESRMLLRDGSLRTVRWRTAIFRDEDDRPSGVLFSGEDITDRIEARKKLYHYQERLRALSIEQNRIEDRERRRVATLLHDRVGQGLVALKLRLELIDVENPVLAEALRGVAEGLGEAIEETRSMTYELHPPILHDLGLSAALSWLSREFREKIGVLIDFEDLTGDHAPLFDDDMKGFVFQAARELLVNVGKHSKAVRCRVTLARAGQCLKLVVKDDGVGFDPSVMEHRMRGHGGYGLFNIRERLKHLGGNFAIESVEGSGTWVSFSLKTAWKRVSGRGAPVKTRMTAEGR